MATFFGFAIADSMFPVGCVIRKSAVDPVQDGAAIEAATPCLNPSHAATIAAMVSRYGLALTIPAKPPQISLAVGDSVIVAGVRGLPRLTDRHEYTEAEIASASFSFSRYSVE